jgi:simple sugar transport system ATP-binding protein
VGAAEAVRAELFTLRAKGAGVLLVSEDLDELVRMSDRIGVLFRGRLSRIRPAAEFDRARLGLLLGGGEA